MPTDRLVIINMLPRRRRLRMTDSSPTPSGGISIVTGRLTASSTVYPKSCYAPGFQVSISPSRFLAMIASSEHSTIAASLAWAISAALRSVTSSMVSNMSGERCSTMSSTLRPIFGNLCVTICCPACDMTGRLIRASSLTSPAPRAQPAAGYLGPL